MEITAGDSRERDPVYYGKVLWRRKWLILAILVLVIGGTVGLDSVRSRQYQGTATLLFVSQNYAADGSANPLQPADILTDIELVQSQAVVNKVSAALHTKAPRPTVTEVGTTDVAQISVVGKTPSLAATAANDYMNAFIQVSRSDYFATQLAIEAQIQKQIDSLQTQANNIDTQIGAQSSNSSVTTTLDSELGGIESQLQSLHSQLLQIQVQVDQASAAGRIVTPATLSKSPVSPKPIEDGLIAGFLGLVLAVGLALLLDYLDDRIRTMDELHHLIGDLPALGIIPQFEVQEGSAQSELVAAARPNSPPAEAYRGLRTSVQFMALSQSFRTLQITSPSAAEGKTTTSANLAIAMAQSGERVILVSCDLRRPRVHEFFGLPNNVGFTSVLIGQATLAQALRPITGAPGLSVLPSGPVPPNPSELLGSNATHELLEELAEMCDVVVLDGPPILPVTDASVLATHVDATIMVCSATSTTRREVRRALDLLRRVEAKVVGVVLNKAAGADTYVYYRYGYGYASDNHERTNGAPAMPVERNGNGSNDYGTAPTRRARTEARRASGSIGQRGGPHPELSDAPVPPES